MADELFSDAAPQERAATGDEARKVLAKFWVPGPTDDRGVRPEMYPLPSPAQIERWGPRGAAKYVLERFRKMQAAKRDPLWHGWEPPVYTLTDCLAGFPWVDKELAEEVRRVLGFARPVRTLFLSGANKSSKTEYCCSRASRLIWGRPGTDQIPRDKIVLCYDATEKVSKIKMQERMHKFMPEPYRSLARGKRGVSEGGVTSIQYSTKGGFTDNLYVTPGGSRCSFQFYEQKIDVIEGVDADMVVADECSNAELIEKLKRATATKDGWFLIPWTPINGFTPAVRMFYQDSEVVMNSPAFLLPADGGEPDLETAMYVEDLLWRVVNGQTMVQ